MPLKKQQENLYYSFYSNNIHFVSVNSEIPYDFNSIYKKEFRDWIEDDLKNSNKTWKIALT